MRTCFIVLIVPTLKETFEFWILSWKKIYVWIDKICEKKKYPEVFQYPHLTDATMW
jgi:hypothetical protein